MRRSTKRDHAGRKSWSVIVSAALLTMLFALVMGTASASAQNKPGQFQPAGAPNVWLPAEPELDVDGRPTIADIPVEFLGTWRSDNPRGDSEFGGDCGSLKDDYGNPRELCEFKVSQLEPYMNGRMRAWIQFFDEPLGPRWTCVAAGLQTGLQEGYLWSLSSTPDALVQTWEQSAWQREIWMDGRPHPPNMRSYYHGHSIGKVVSPTEMVVHSANFTFDAEGWDDHSHLATSHMKKLTERYMLDPNDPDRMYIEFTVDDPVFLKKPFTWRKRYVRTNRPFVTKWDCDVEAGLEEVYKTIPQRYPDDTEWLRRNEKNADVQKILQPLLQQEQQRRGQQQQQQ
jgi:hypothetical protein